MRLIKVSALKRRSVLEREENGSPIDSAIIHLICDHNEEKIHNGTFDAEFNGPSDMFLSVTEDEYSDLFSKIGC